MVGKFTFYLSREQLKYFKPSLIKKKKMKPPHAKLREQIPDCELISLFLSKSLLRWNFSAMKLTSS